MFCCSWLGVCLSRPPAAASSYASCFRKLMGGLVWICDLVRCFDVGEFIFLSYSSPRLLGNFSGHLGRLRATCGASLFAIVS